MGHLKTAKCECLWSSAKHTAEAVTYQGKNYIYPKGKIVKSLHHYVLSQWKRFWVYIYALCLVCFHKCFTLTGGLKSGKRECLWSSAEHTAEAVTCQGRNIFIPQQKSSNLCIIYVLCQWKRFWLCVHAHCSNMRSQMFYTRGSFEICQERTFVKQRQKHSWSS